MRPPPPPKPQHPPPLSLRAPSQPPPLYLSLLMTCIALRNLALGRPPPEQLAQEVAFANGEQGEGEEGGGARPPEL